MTLTYRGREATVFQETEEQLKQRTQEQVERDHLKTEKNLREFHRYIDFRARMFRKIPSKRKQRMFLNTVSRLRKYADLHDGLLEVEISRHVGTITLTLECVQHTIDSIDSTRFLFALLFLRYEGISIFPCEDALRIQPRVMSKTNASGNYRRKAVRSASSPG